MVNQRDLVGQIIFSLVASSTQKHLFISVKEQFIFTFIYIILIFLKKSTSKL